MKFTYLLSCYGPDAYIFSIPLRASENWLKKHLKRKWLIDATPLTRKQFDLLKQRIPTGMEVGWYKELEYYLEGREIKTPREAIAPST